LNKAGQGAYDLSVARPALWTICLAVGFASSLATAQFHGVPASVTSVPRGGDLFSAPGVPAGVTSLGPSGFGPTLGINLDNSFDPHFHFFIPRLSQFRAIRPIVVVPLAVPFYPAYYPAYPIYSGAVYSTGVEAPQPVVRESEEEEPPALTIFERRGRSSYRAPEPSRYGEHIFGERRVPSRETEAGAAQPAAEKPAATPEEQQVTILVYRDGHRREIRNYAVLGKTLFDLSSGRMLRVPLAELDLAATRKANEEAGVEFVLP